MGNMARKLVATTGVFAVAASAFAGDAGGGSGKTLLGAVFSGGPLGVSIMCAIILMSVAFLALTIEHFVSIRREKLAPPYIFTELENLIEEQEYDEAMDLCESEDCFLTRVVQAGLSRMDSGTVRMDTALADARDDEAMLLHQKISWLALIGALAPMMGLLGTVIGMIQAFAKLAEAEGGADPAVLAGGINLALYSTAMGLILAIPVMTFYSYFRSKVIKTVQEVDTFTSQLFDRIQAA